MCSRLASIHTVSSVTASPDETQFVHMAEVVALREPVTAIASSRHHCAAVTAEGQLYCWGRNDHGQVRYSAVVCFGVRKYVCVRLSVCVLRVCELLVCFIASTSLRSVQVFVAGAAAQRKHPRPTTLTSLPRMLRLVHPPRHLSLLLTVL